MYTNDALFACIPNQQLWRVHGNQGPFHYNSVFALIKFYQLNSVQNIKGATKIVNITLQVTELIYSASEFDS